jgi:hypothetical protein
MKTRLATAVLFGALCVLPATGFAHGKMGKKHMKVISDSAAALSTSNPDLSSRLKELASREGAAKESKEARVSAADEEKDVQTLRDAAAALKVSRPDLAKGLEKCAAMEQKEWKHKGGMKDNKKESPMPETKGQSPAKPSPSGY